MRLTKLLLLIFFTFSLSAYPQEEEVFGVSEKVSDALKGKIYKLPEKTNQLPDFDTLQAVGRLYATELNISNRDFASGFPGVREITEWFGIEYKGDIFVKKAGNYHFRLYSDDGSLLYINDSLIINNDGIHAAVSAHGSIYLDKSRYRIKVKYFQGPRYHIALQLFYTFEDGEEQLFPGEEMELRIPGIKRKKWLWIVLLPILLVGGMVVVQNRRKNKKI